MVLGLKRGSVALVDHDPEWGVVATQTIERLWRIFGSAAKDIQHVGSTAIRHIKAKPIIDIAVGVQSPDSLDDVFSRLELNGFYKSVQHAVPNDTLYVIGDLENITRTHHIHIVTIDGLQWKNYINLRDYLNDCPQKATIYENIKIELAGQYPNDRSSYTKGKDAFFESFLLEARIYAQMRNRFDIMTLDPITKGWSGDKKYCLTKSDGTKYLLRISPIERYESRKNLFAMMEQVSALGIPMCEPVEFGTCDDGVYSLQSWIDGEDLETVLPLLPETEQYVLGLKSGEIIRKMHTIPAPETQEEWAVRFNRKTDYKIQKYHECGLRFEGDTHILAYIKKNRHLLENRPQCFQHGDYHIGNMMLENGELIIIDFDRYDFGDPWEEFNRIVWSAAASPHFATGQLRGYFGGEPPLEFFELLAFYVASNTLSSIYWAVPFGQSDLDTMMKQAQDVLDWFDNMNNPVPTWYLKDFYIQWTDGVPYKLKSPFDFSFLKKYGKVFKVFDAQDSGNICFGMENGDKRYFVKYAGAPTERACVSADEAIANLKRTVPIYLDLAHPNLIKFVDAEEIGGAGSPCDGFAMIFEWVDAECMHPMYPLSRKKFMQMSLETRQAVFEDIIAFHAYVAKRGYVAIDFYDGSIMYDFNAGKTVICDIDFYDKSPYINSMGRMWGSSRFMSPEEFELGAAIDEITNVYTMGATAFALFGNEQDRSIEKWRLSKGLFDVAKKAVSDDREKRQQSIEEFIAEWRAAK